MYLLTYYIKALLCVGILNISTYFSFIFLAMADLKEISFVLCYALLRGCLTCLWVKMVTFCILCPPTF